MCLLYDTESVRKSGLNHGILKEHAHLNPFQIEVAI